MEGKTIVDAKNKSLEQLKVNVEMFERDNPFIVTDPNEVVLLIAEQVGRVSESLLYGNDLAVNRRIKELTVFMVAIWRKSASEVEERDAKALIRKHGATFPQKQFGAIE